MCVRNMAIATGPRCGAMVHGTSAPADRMPAQSLSGQATQLATLLSQASWLAARISQALVAPRRRRGARGKRHKQGSVSSDAADEKLNWQPILLGPMTRGEALRLVSQGGAFHPCLSATSPPPSTPPRGSHTVSALTAVSTTPPKRCLPRSAQCSPETYYIGEYSKASSSSCTTSRKASATATATGRYPATTKASSTGSPPLAPTAGRSVASSTASPMASRTDSSRGNQPSAEALSSPPPSPQWPSSSEPAQPPSTFGSSFGHALWRVVRHCVAGIRRNGGHSGSFGH